MPSHLNHHFSDPVNPPTIANQLYFVTHVLLVMLGMLVRHADVENNAGDVDGLVTNTSICEIML